MTRRQWNIAAAHLSLSLRRAAEAYSAASSQAFFVNPSAGTSLLFPWGRCEASGDPWSALVVEVEQVDGRAGVPGSPLHRPAESWGVGLSGTVEPEKEKEGDRE